MVEKIQSVYYVLLLFLMLRSEHQNYELILNELAQKPVGKLLILGVTHYALTLDQTVMYVDKSLAFLEP